jgi:hypothetical protein
MPHALMAAIGLGALLVGAPARAEDNPACAKFEEPLAFNACLAKFGPRAHESKAIAAEAGGRRSARGGEISRARRGRVRLEFDVAGKRRR